MQLKIPTWIFQNRKQQLLRHVRYGTDKLITPLSKQFLNRGVLLLISHELSIGQEWVKMTNSGKFSSQAEGNMFISLTMEEKHLSGSYQENHPCTSVRIAQITCTYQSWRTQELSKEASWSMTVLKWQIRCKEVRVPRELVKVDEQQIGHNYYLTLNLSRNKEFVFWSVLARSTCSKIVV